MDQGERFPRLKMSSYSHVLRHFRVICEHEGAGTVANCMDEILISALHPILMKFCGCYALHCRKIGNRPRVFGSLSKLGASFLRDP